MSAYAVAKQTQNRRVMDFVNARTGLYDRRAVPL